MNGVRTLKKQIGWVLAVVLVILLALSVAGYGQEGIPDRIDEDRYDIEVTAVPVQPVHADDTAIDSTHFSVIFRNPFYDGNEASITYDVIPKDKGILLAGRNPNEMIRVLTLVDEEKGQICEENKTVLNLWDDGNYDAFYLVEVNHVDDVSGVEFVRHYGDGSVGILDMETGTYTGEIVVHFDQYKPERNLFFSVRMLPFNDIHDENSENYDLSENASIEWTLSTDQLTDGVVDSSEKAIA